MIDQANEMRVFDIFSKILKDQDVEKGSSVDKMF